MSMVGAENVPRQLSMAAGWCGFFMGSTTLRSMED